MSVVEMAILFGFGVPIVVLSGAFVVMASLLQSAENEKELAAGHR